MTQASQKFSADDINKFVSETVKYVMIQEYTKYPIKRADFTKHPLKGVGRQYEEIIKIVQRKMLHCFGLKLVELQNAQCYIVVNKFSSDTLSGIVVPKEKDQRNNGLLTVILTYIFMAGGVVKEDDMWAFLKKLKVCPEEQPDGRDNIFGDVKKLITVEFVRQMYLDLPRIPQTDPPVVEFRWGARAEIEVDKEQILNFASQMHSNVDPKRWTAQWAIVQEEKARRAAKDEENNENMSE